MSITKRDIQLVEKEILDDLIRVCDENNITYYLGQGTLIGAARHKGFIPWDDDIDVLMSYKDMDKLLEIYPKYGCEDYTITHFTNEKYNPLSWAKIRSDKTLSRPFKHKALPIHWGICIDVFPYYPCSSNSLIRKFEVFLFKFGRKLNYAGMTQFEDGHGTVTRLLEKLPLWLRHFFLRLSFAIFSLHSDNSKYVVVLCKTNNVVERTVLEYMLQLVNATRKDEAIEVGVSPRGSIALYKACQAYAAIHNRTYVVPDDVKTLVPYVFNKRVILKPNALMKGYTNAEVISRILEQEPVPNYSAK